MPRSTHTPLLRAIQSLAADHALADRAGMPVPQAREERRREAAITRRRFIGGAAAGAAGLAASMALPGHAMAAKGGKSGLAEARIAIVGGGIAGLSAALALADKGVAATVYEASSRIGGRMYSNTTYWNDGQVSEWGGELIDTNHRTIRDLARRFGLTLTDLLRAEPSGSEETYYFGGGYYPAAMADHDFAPVYQALRDDVRGAGYPTTRDSNTATGRALDNMSIRQWINSRVPGGFGSRFGQLLDVAYNIEFGAETTDQAALNLVYMLGYSPRRLAMFGESDERFHIDGGNQQLPERIAAALPGDVKLGWRLTTIGQGTDEVELRFATNGGTQTIRADHAILTLPFAVLKTLDTTGADFDARKRNAINSLGAGRNGKLQLQFSSRHWNQNGPWPGVSNGATYSDTGYQATWDVSRGQSGASGILVNYTGGNVTGAIPGNTAFADRTTNPNLGALGNQFLQKIEQVFPGLTAKWTGKATLSVPHHDPNLRLAYSYYRAGQYQQFGGYEPVRQGNIHFAGEHTTQDFQGFMEGGALTGTQAAAEVLADLR